PRLLRTLAPERCGDVADAHDLVDHGVECTLQFGAERFLAAAGLAAHDDSPDRREAHSLRGGGLGNMQGVRRRAGERLGLKPLDRGEELVGVAHADRDVHRADRLEGGERGAGDERAGGASLGTIATGGSGYSSPVLAGNTLFLTSGFPGTALLALDIDLKTILWT